jgi:NAD(P)-dependent dehydrogenase (short-subunit alcohol dehydrogenase family)
VPFLNGVDCDFSKWQEEINILLKGPLRVVQAFLPRLAAGAKIINITSRIGTSTWPMGGMHGYAAAKAGLNRLMRSVAIDLKPRGIMVALVHPGYVKTELGGPNAEISPEESAAGIRGVAEALTLESTGAFFKWTGEPHPW